jgi:hypothetical protein
MSLHSEHTIRELGFYFPNIAAMPSNKPAKFNDEELMKNKHRIELLESTVQHLEQHLEVALNRLAILEMKAFPKVPVAAPVEWPTWKPNWINTPFVAPDPNVVPYKVMCQQAGSPTVH